MGALFWIGQFANAFFVILALAVGLIFGAVIIMKDIVFKK
jgi:hypothetical protein